MEQARATIALIDDLKARIGRLGQPAKAADRVVIPFGIGAVDTRLPGGGLALGALHEVSGGGPDVEHGAAAALLIAGVLARLPRPGAVGGRASRTCSRRRSMRSGYRPIASSTPRRARPKTVLMAMEEGLRHAGLAGVVGELSGRLTLIASRRLQLAAEQSGVICFALRRSRNHDDPALAEPTAAVDPLARLRPALAAAVAARARDARPGPRRDGGWTFCAAAAANRQPGSWRQAMRRVISIFLPTWPTDRLRRQPSAAVPPPDRPLVTAIHDGRRQSVAAVDAAARAEGLRPGMPLAQAQAMVPGLAVVPADPEGDARALDALAAWCLRYAPLTSADAPDGIWIDATGCRASVRRRGRAAGRHRRAPCARWHRRPGGHRRHARRRLGDGALCGDAHHGGARRRGRGVRWRRCRSRPCGCRRTRWTASPGWGSTASSS